MHPHPEEAAERLDELEPSSAGSPADVVVELDVGRLARVPVPGFDHVRGRACPGEEVGVGEPFGGFLEDVD